MGMFNFLCPSIYEEYRNLLQSYLKNYIKHYINPIQPVEVGFHLPPVKKKVIQATNDIQMSPDFMTFPKYVLGTYWVIKNN